MQSIQSLAAQSHVKAALLNLLASLQAEGAYLTTARASVTLDHGDAHGEYEVGGLSRDEFHPLTGGSL